LACRRFDHTPVDTLN